LAVPNAVISDPFELIKIVRYTKKALCQISPRIERISPFDFRADTARRTRQAMGERIQRGNHPPLHHPPSGAEAYAKAEVTVGGVDTARDVPGPYVIGETLDVIGHLGGFNLHWAFASGQACGEAV